VKKMAAISRVITMVVTSDRNLKAATVNNRLGGVRSTAVFEIGPEFDDGENSWQQILDEFCRIRPKAVLLDDGFSEKMFEVLRVICDATGVEYGWLRDMPGYAANVSRFS
jgi:hypothetical protein